eukprot:CAMPEP_0206142408 /NCGR_PEP_ID=MMETSP1473-20131121/16757_1 /ASSEMBLY_ACC=CAM_ASM_001109 /TAXON_ID=1461547 /ORGANISM="Stichococcus sp, Strain RCC1054" /LENGTH=46 /DNA_ID= /DNA_START= /DNA_END= /DNA_ORIENTATION=
MTSYCEGSRQGKDGKTLAHILAGNKIDLYSARAAATSTNLELHTDS